MDFFQDFHDMDFEVKTTKIILELFLNEKSGNMLVYQGFISNLRKHNCTVFVFTLSWL